MRCIRSAVQGKAARLLSASAHDALYISCVLVNDRHCGLRLRDIVAALRQNRIALIHDGVLVIRNIGGCLIHAVKQQIKV